MSALPRQLNLLRPLLCAIGLLIVCVSGCCLPSGSRWPVAPWSDDGYPNFVPGTGIPYTFYGQQLRGEPYGLPKSAVPRIPSQRSPGFKSDNRQQAPRTLTDLEGSSVVPQGLNVPAALQLQVDTASRRQVGSSATFRLMLENLGDRPVNSVIIKAEFDEAFVFPGHPDKKIQQSLGRIPGGQSLEIAVTLFSDQVGSHCCSFSVIADGVESVWKSVCVEFTPRQLEVGMFGPTDRFLGSRAEYTVKLVNTSSSPLKGVVANIRFDAALKPREGSAGAERMPGSLKWPIDTLKAGEGVQLQVEFECIALSERSCIALDLVAEGISREQSQICLKIAPVVGALDVHVSDRDDPISVGEESDFLVTIHNRASRPVRDVGVVVDLPEIFRVISTEVTSGERILTRKTRVEGRIVEFSDIKILPVRETLTYRIRIKALRSGDVDFRVRLRHAGSPSALEISEPISVNP